MQGFRHLVEADVAVAGGSLADPGHLPGFVVKAAFVSAAEVSVKAVSAGVTEAEIAAAVLAAEVPVVVYPAGVLAVVADLSADRLFG